MTTYKNDYLHDKYKTAPSHNKKVTRVHASTAKNTSKQPHYRLRKWLFGSSIVLVLFLTFFWQPVSDTSTVMFSSASSEIKEAGRDAGLNMHGQAVFLSNNPEFVDADTLASNCPHDDEIIEFGCYLPSSHKIYILQINDDQLKPTELTSVAHETLHAVWNDMSYDDRTAIGGELTMLYDSKTSDALTNDAKPYQKEDATVFVNELHSLAGSEVDLSEMPNSLREHFSKYFSDQDKTVQANIDFNQNIDSEIANIKSQRDQLDTESKNLDDFQAAHLDSIKAYMQQNLYYGDIATYNKNVDAYNHNREIYNDMVATYNTNVSSYNSARQSFIDAYSALFPGKVIPVPDAK
jgi:hypothetical protein